MSEQVRSYKQTPLPSLHLSLKVTWVCRFVLRTFRRWPLRVMNGIDFCNNSVYVVTIGRLAEFFGNWSSPLPADVIQTQVCIQWVLSGHRETSLTFLQSHFHRAARDIQKYLLPETIQVTLGKWSRLFLKAGEHIDCTEIFHLLSNYLPLSGSWDSSGSSRKSPVKVIRINRRLQVPRINGRAEGQVDSYGY